MPTHEITVIREFKDTGPRIWLLGSLKSVVHLPPKVSDARVCNCGFIFAWAGGPDVEPACPNCKRPAKE
jgi:hypothetical protein